MKRVLSLMIVAVLAITSTVSAQSGVDTFVNKGDGKVVIIDQRPRTIINRLNAPKPVDPVIIKEQTPVVNNYYPIERVIEMPQQAQNNNWLVPLLAIGLVAWFIIWLLQRGDKCNCGCHSQCNHNQPVPPVINHFHVAGGNAVIDTSENLSNYQPEHHYHKHTHMPMFPFMGNPRASQTATGSEKTEVKS